MFLFLRTLFQIGPELKYRSFILFSFLRTLFLLFLPILVAWLGLSVAGAIGLVAAMPSGPGPIPDREIATIAAGCPIEAVAQAETMRVPDQLLGSRPCFVLQVSGDSMIEAGILDGDYVVIEQRDSANNGEIVVALVADEDVTLKRIEQKPGRVILHPEQPCRGLTILADRKPVPSDNNIAPARS